MKKILVLLLFILSTAGFAQSPPLSTSALKVLINTNLTPVGASKVSAVALREVQGAIVDALDATASGLQSATALQSNSYLAIAGVQALNITSGKAPKAIFITDSGKAGLFSLDASDSTTPDNGATVLVTASGLRYKRVAPLNRFTGTDWMKGDGTTNDRAAFITMMNSATLLSGKGVVDLGWKTYNLGNGGVVLDLSKIHFVNGGVLTCPTITSGTCVTIRGRGDGGLPPYMQASSGLDYVEIAGPGKAYASTVGVSWESPNEPGPAHSIYNGLIVHGFGTGKQFGANAYLLGFNGGAVFDNNTGHRFLNATNAGENITFYGKYANFNNDTAFVAMNPNSDIFYTNASLDYNVGRVGRMTGGSVDLTGAHVEWKNATAPQFKLSGNGTSLRMSGGWLLSTEALTQPEAIFDIRTSPGTGGGVWMDNVRVSTVATSSDMWCTSATTGNFYPYRLHGYDIMGVPKFTSLVENLALNYLPDTDAFRDKIIVQGTDSLLVASPTATSVGVTNSVVSLSTTSGTNYYRHTKIYGGGSTSRMQIAIPIAPGRISNIRLNYEKPGSSTGLVYLSWQYASEPDAKGRFGKVQAIGTTPLTLTSSATSGTFSSAEPLTRAPSWARYLIFEVNADGWSASGDSMRYHHILVNQQ